MREVQDALGELKDQVVGAGQTWVVGTNVQYAVHQEFGTTRMQAQPYLRPAVKEVMRNDGTRLADQAGGADELVASIAVQVERKAKQKAPVDTGNLKGSIKAVKL